MVHVPDIEGELLVGGNKPALHPAGRVLDDIAAAHHSAPQGKHRLVGGLGVDRICGVGARCAVGQAIAAGELAAYLPHVVAIADPNPLRLEAAQRLLGVEVPAYTDVGRLLAERRPEVVLHSGSDFKTPTPEFGIGTDRLGKIAFDAFTDHARRTGTLPAKTLVTTYLKTERAGDFFPLTRDVDLRKDVQLNTRVLTAHFDSPSNLWTITTDTGETVRAPYVVMATGNLSTPRVPDFPGLGDFQGASAGAFSSMPRQIAAALSRLPSCSAAMRLTPPT